MPRLDSFHVLQMPHKQGARQDWRLFERAVASFVSALEPSASVRVNARLPDRHTGRLRERDVWVETSFGGVFPLKILISCKRLRRPVNEQDIDAFAGELASSGAHKGVLYSFRGFTSPALEKAATLGICACRLLQNEAADIPSQLPFYAFCVVPAISVGLVAPPPPNRPLSTFADLFSLRSGTDESGPPFGSFVASVLIQAHADALAALTPADALPSVREKVVTIHDNSGEVPDIKVYIGLRWLVYRGTAFMNLLNGSYSYTTGQFVGTEAITLRPPAQLPDTAWELVEGAQEVTEAWGVTFRKPLGDVPQILQDILGPRPIEFSIPKNGV